MVERSRTEKLRSAALSYVLMAVLVLGPCAGCRFPSNQLECELPTDAELVIPNCEPVPTLPEPDPRIPAVPASMSVENPDFKKWYMTMDEAIAIALQKNPVLLVSHYSPRESQEVITMQDSQFDPLLQMGGGWSRTASQITNVLDGPGTGITSTSTDFFGPPQGLADQIRLSKQTRLGGSLAANFGTQYMFYDPGGNFLALNPNIRSNFSVHASQPFGKGSGRKVNAIGIRIARQTHHSATYQVNVQVRSTVFSVVSAYWNLYGAISQLISMDQSVVQGRETWEKEKERLELGDSAAPNVAEARAALEKFRSRQVTARRSVADAERALRDLLGLPHEDGSRITPVTLPHKLEPDLNWEQAVINAVNVRPEMSLAKSNLKIARYNVDTARDGLRPDLEGYAQWTLSGAADKFDESVRIVADNDFHSWQMGFVFQKQLGRRLDRASMRQAQLAQSRTAKSVEVTRRQIYTELHAAYQSVATAWEVIQLQRARRAASLEVLNARKEMYNIGEISLETYLRATAEWSSSMAEERSAIALYNSALAQWELARGTILNSYGIDFEVYDPDNPNENDEAEFLHDYMNPPKARQDEGEDQIDEPNPPFLDPPRHAGIDFNILTPFERPRVSWIPPVSRFEYSMTVEQLQFWEQHDIAVAYNPNGDGHALPVSPPRTYGRGISHQATQGPAGDQHAMNRQELKQPKAKIRLNGTIELRPSSN